MYHFHEKTVHAFVELLAAAGLHSPSELQRYHIYRRVSYSKVLRYDQLYPNIPVGCLVGSSDAIPEVFRRQMLEHLD